MDYKLVDIENMCVCLVYYFIFNVCHVNLVCKTGVKYLLVNRLLNERMDEQPF